MGLTAITLEAIGLEAARLAESRPAAVSLDSRPKGASAWSGSLTKQPLVSLSREGKKGVKVKT